MRPDDRPLVLDACACINAAAALRLKVLPSSLATRVLMVDVAAAEALYLHDEIDGRRERALIDVSSLEQVTLSPSELDLFVRLSGRLDDGEAASLAVAQSRGWTVATDDRAARRAATTLVPEIDLVSTAELLKASFEGLGLDGSEMSRRLREVERRASYIPRADDPLRGWWADPATG